MIVYFVRHGETLFNRRRIHQHPDVPLSERGRTQIQKTAERLREVGATKLLTSDLRRARESAAIIGASLNVRPEEETLFREVRRPSKIYNTPHIGLPSLWAGAWILFNIHRPNWHYDDEENLYDLKRRVAAAVDFLVEIGKEHERVIVVSHAFLIQTFIKYMCVYKDVRARDYLRTLVSATHLQNAGITTLAFSDDRNPNTCDWVALELNDVAHL